MHSSRWVSALTASTHPTHFKPLRVPSASGRVNAGAFCAVIHQPLDPRVILAAFGGFRCASSTLRYAVESVIMEFLCEMGNCDAQSAARDHSRIFRIRIFP